MSHRPLEEPDADSFRKGMRQLAAGVSIIAAETGGERAGLTATAVCSVTTDPPSLLVCVNRSAGAHDVIARAGRLSVNVLKRDSEDIARRFAGMVKGVGGAQRFVEDHWENGRHGPPVLRDALAVFECRVSEATAFGTHTIFLCEVLSAAAMEAADAPLIYVNGEFCQPQPNL